MVVLNGIKNFLQFVNDNWTIITIIFGLLIALAVKIKDYVSKSKEEKIAIAKSQTEEEIAVAKSQIKQIIMKLITDAEVSYRDWVKAGSVKRSQVIEHIFLEFPILSKVTDQDSLITWIDNVIDEALKTMREIFEKNSDKSAEDVEVTVDVEVTK